MNLKVRFALVLRHIEHEAAEPPESRFISKSRVPDQLLTKNSM
jgi:hypothetical protein